LQQFLAQDPSIYPEGTTSGYFGALTEKAVQRWQAKNNIVSSGTPGTSGYGVVGPRTAAAIALLCSTGASSPVGGYIQVSPISGNAPLNVNVVATVNSTNSCAGAIYLLNWGDGTNSISIPVSANNCQPVSQTYQHTYTSGGTYQITLSSGAHQTGASVTVFGGTNTTTTGGGTGTQTQAPSETFTATPTSGAAPLTVTFSGIVTGADQGWCSSGCSDIMTLGDGSQAAVPLPTSQTQSQSYSLQHTYANAGTYTATLYQGQVGSGRPTVGTPATITVTGGSSSNTTNTTTYNPPSVTPGVGGNPLAVTISYDVYSCTKTSIGWGDGTALAASGVSGCAGIPQGNSQTISQSHTYANAGNYTITLMRDGQTNTAGVTIQ
jgi:PKD repeat protein